jgi:serine protease inhibitor
LQNKSELYDIGVGTRFFMDKKFEARLRFKAMCEQYYATEIRDDVDFENLDETETTINEWCAQATRDNIKNIVKKGKF